MLTRVAICGEFHPNLFLTNPHDQVLIFSQMTSILDILMDYCYLRGFQYSRLDGSMSYAERDENVGFKVQEHIKNI